MAFESGHGRTAVPARSTIASLALAVATVTGVTSFSTSLGNLFDDPQLYGWNSDVQVGDSFSPPLDAEAQRLLRHPGVTAMAVGSIARLQIGSLLADTLATESGRAHRTDGYRGTSTPYSRRDPPGHPHVASARHPRGRRGDGRFG